MPKFMVAPLVYNDILCDSKDRLFKHADFGFPLRCIFAYLEYVVFDKGRHLQNVKLFPLLDVQ
jgi:hypothetical protein